MNTATKICKTCGKAYEACYTIRRDPGVFRWQDVACSPECGQQYLTAIRISRGEIQPEQTMIEHRVMDDESTELGFIDEDYEDEDENDLDDYFD
jgi:hypothetical protein